MRGTTEYIIILAIIIGPVSSLRLLELDVPTHKVVGESAKLTCKFDMEGAALYSVKWYRNEQEFYRFVPNDRPKLQIFQTKGIKVERSKSSRQHVFLTDLQIDATGTYKCEVSAEAPSFRTKNEEKLMVVVQPPKHNEIRGVKDRYYVGDRVNVTCYSRGSSPPASLLWKVNDVQVFDQSAVFKEYELGTSDFFRNSQEEDERYPRFSGSDVINTFEVIQHEPAVVANIRDWFEKDADPSLDTAASTLQFTVQDIHRHLGLRIDCVASIGPVYWHTTQENCLVTARERELPPLFGTSPRNTGLSLLLVVITSLMLLW